MSRTRVRRRRLTLTVSLALVAAAWAGPAMRALGPPERPERVSRTSYVVREGDTLWSIARRVSPGDDPRPLVDTLATVNRIDAGELVPGQTLVISAS
ncbi:MAG: LysM peptidoglycan-binding domain-containing protein [Actinomycetota bacterium]